MSIDFDAIVLRRESQQDVRKLNHKQQQQFSLWFWGLLACPELYCDWSLHNQHS